MRRERTGKSKATAPKVYEDKIMTAYRSGSIDEETKILLYLRLLFDTEHLSREYIPDAPIKSGTTIVEEIYNYIGKRNARKDIVEEANRYLESAVPPLDRVYTSPGGFFTLHYTTKGTNAVPGSGSPNIEVPAYVKAAGEYFDRSKYVTCDLRGFKKPVLDYGKESYHVYIYDLKGKYGITFPISFYNTGKYKPRVASGFISIDNNYSSAKGFKKSWEDCLKVTAAHEFFHAVQNAYNADADSWWKEASATWNEDEVYDSVNDYFQYLGNVFSAPDKPLENSSYGGVVFAKYLSENYGGYSIIKSIWECQAERFRNSINAIDYAIRQSYSGENIGTLYGGYAACNFNPAQYYREGKLWQQSVSIRDTHTAYPVAQRDGKLDHLASNYQLFKPFSQGSKSLKITVEGSKDVNWGIKVQKRRKIDGLCDEAKVRLDSSRQRAEILCDSFGDYYSEVCLIPANLEKNLDGAVYKYSAVVE
jgi:hypothetical protein